MTEEQVLCVPREALEDCGYFEGFTPMSEAYEQLFSAEVQQFHPRAAAEQDPSLKQLIPYVIVMRNSLVLNYFRGKGQGEQRLHGKRSLGIGGHINPCDMGDDVVGELKDRPEFLTDMYVRGMLRELHEELQFREPPKAWDAPIVGLINEDVTEVGKVHLGVVHMLRLDFGCKCTAREEDINNLAWTNAGVLLQPKQQEQFELWSKICLTALQGQWQERKPKKKHAPISKKPTRKVQSTDAAHE